MTRAATKRAAARQATAPKQVRVAVYTRKSVADGLDQAFNTLDAQRQAVEGYVASMAGDGWVALPDRYDDGGYSGATTDRPAFRRLMADVADGKVDVVAVYRLDRMTRSLMDFGSLMREFEQRGVAFVSVTERFDTSTPAGRLLLNLLATFAEFERESIAQRTRDKVRATRKRGAWTGGRPVLGYDVREKRLVVNEAEAEQVRRIFALYLEVGGTVALAQELRLLGIRNKRFVTAAGAETGGSVFEKNSLLALLRNPAYVGRLRAGDEIVEGEHEAIVDEATWDAVQAQLDAQAPEVRARSPRRCTALLSGIARCRCGAAMTPTSTKRGGAKYAYYACAEAVKRGKDACPGSRVAAGKLERLVVERVREVARDPAVLDAAVAADREERDTERERLTTAAHELRAARGRHAGERQRLLDAVGDEDVPEGLLGRVRELDDLVAVADARLAGLERDVRALEGDADAEGLRAALAEFDTVWAALDPDEQARVLALVLDEVVVDGAAGDAELRFRGWR